MSQMILMLSPADQETSESSKRFQASAETYTVSALHCTALHCTALCCCLSNFLFIFLPLSLAFLPYQFLSFVSVYPKPHSFLFSPLPNPLLTPLHSSPSPSPSPSPVSTLQIVTGQKDAMDCLVHLMGGGFTSQPMDFLSSHLAGLDAVRYTPSTSMHTSHT
jgi:hypothetical protein